MSKVCSNNVRNGTAVAVRDRTSLVQIQCPYKPGFRPDSGVDVFGYPNLANGELILKDAMILPTGSTPTLAKQISHDSSTAATTEASLPLLQTAQSIRRLSRSEAARGCPVILEGVVTFSDPRWKSLFVQDASGGIFVTPAGRVHDSSRRADPSQGNNGGGRFRADRLQGRL